LNYETYFRAQIDSAPEGRTFAERYQVREFPHISIIDPRTGRLMWRKEGWTQQNAMTSATFAEIAMDFCSRNSFERPPQAHRPPNAAVASAFLPSTTPAKRMHEMSEEEQLQAAMRASMTEAGAVTSSDHIDITSIDDNLDDNDASDVQIMDDTKPQAIGKAKEEEEEEASLNDELQTYIVPDEPTTVDNVSRIQFRMVDGKKVVRKFSSSDPVRAIYAFVAVRLHFELLLFRASKSELTIQTNKLQSLFRNSKRLTKLGTMDVNLF
jgi:UBX domain-containing protein 7